MKRNDFQGSEWLAKEADDKRAELWAACEESEYTTADAVPRRLDQLDQAAKAQLANLVAPRFVAGALGFDREKSKLSFEDHDTLPGERLKLLHGLGVVAQVVFEPGADATGLFAAPFAALMRLSDGRVGVQFDDEIIQSGAGLKLLRTGAPSLDLLFGHSLKQRRGEDTQHFFDFDLTTEFKAAPERDNVRESGREVQGIFQAALAEIPKMGPRDGLKLPPQPDWGLDPYTKLILQVHPEAKRAVGTTGDFRDRLALIPGGTPLFNVMIGDRTLGLLRVRPQTRLLISQFADRDLWFRHPMPAPPR